MHRIAEKMAALRRAVKKHVEQVKKLFENEKATSNIEIDINWMFLSGESKSRQRPGRS